MMDRIKRSFFNTALIGGFCLLAGAIIKPLAAELDFNAAERYAKSYRWEKVDAKFENAIRMDPFSAKYLAGYAEFLRKSARYSYNKGKLLERAEDFYNKAIRLEPRNGEHWLKRSLGRLELAGEINRNYSSGFPEKKLIEIRKLIVKIFDDFRQAVKNDPNGFNTAYSTGYAGIGFWKDISGGDKELVLDRLKYAFRIKPWECKTVYARAWRVTKDFSVLRRITPDDLAAQQTLYNFIASNNLWQFRKEQASKVESYKSRDSGAGRAARAEKIKKLILEAGRLADANAWTMVDDKWQMAKGGEAVVAKNKAAAERRQQGIIAPEDWVVVSKDLRKISYNEGAMYSNGTMYALIELPVGKSVIKITAKGTAAQRVWPYMVIGIDGKETGETFVDSAEAKEYSFGLDTAGGLRVMSVTFVNDFCKNGEDRNLFVESVKVVQR